MTQDGYSLRSTLAGCLLRSALAGYEIEEIDEALALPVMYGVKLVPLDCDEDGGRILYQGATRRRRFAPTRIV